MTEPTENQMEAAQAPDSHEPSLSEMAARRVAARTQWQKALARAKERFSPANIRNEAVDTAADAIGAAADKAGALAWAHRGKLALASLLGGLILARKPICKVAAPMADQTRTSFRKAARTLRDRFRR